MAEARERALALESLETGAHGVPESPVSPQEQTWGGGCGMGTVFLDGGSGPAPRGPDDVPPRPCDVFLLRLGKQESEPSAAIVGGGDCLLVGARAMLMRAKALSGDMLGEYHDLLMTGVEDERGSVADSSTRVAGDSNAARRSPVCPGADPAVEAGVLTGSEPTAQGTDGACSGNIDSCSRVSSTAAPSPEDRALGVAAPLRFTPSPCPFPTMVEDALDLLQDVEGLTLAGPGPARPAVLFTGQWRGARVAVKVLALPPPAAAAAAAAAALDTAGTGASPPQPAAWRAALEAVVRPARVQHPNLLTMYDVRHACLGPRALEQLRPGPRLRLGWPARGAALRPLGRLHSFLAAQGMAGPPRPPPPSEAITRNPTAADQEPVANDSSLTVHPGDFVYPPDPEPAPGWAALRAVRGLQAGGGVVALVTERCDMGDLRSRAAASPSPFRASPSWTLRVAQRALLRTAREIAGALEALHGAGLAHGCLHPANVLLAASRADRRGFTVRLADAGGAELAAAAAAAADPRTSLRSPVVLAAAPEALRSPDAAHTPAADVYGLGVLLHLMAAGEMPFEGQNLLPVVMALAAGELAPEWPRGQHDHLAPLFARCVAANPQDRPTASQVLADICALEAALKRRPKRALVPE
ncbi:hypothetical protein HYH03_004301 [Edaphochlamys debaryana]|uniref:Protein kinase domain-containing protein n=1 Tax=Edaphochlamys debaryana TaxID=47281 RepID=A0A835YH64_9CHLO|nr:hypothetical protein HYH03_004301 [Edaphochlamys debaryana]|eukprot:KAG2497554.1 hypothetical protein HYH03_004301 [Edaphochlamys debaryana]